MYPDFGPFGEEVRYPAIRDELRRMFEADQQARRDSVAAQVRETDQRHTARLKEIIAEIGWPTTSMVGIYGSEAAWLFAQHSDTDVPFQNMALELMQREPPGEVDPGHVAYLTDRIRGNEGRPQLYGTQFRVDAEGHFAPAPIEDADRVDERKRSAGLAPLAEYQAVMEGFRRESQRKQAQAKECGQEG